MQPQVVPDAAAQGVVDYLRSRSFTQTARSLWDYVRVYDK
jgi:hypothetical protein